MEKISLKKYQFLKQFSYQALSEEDKKMIDHYEREKEIELRELNSSKIKVEENKIQTTKLPFAPINLVREYFEFFYKDLFGVDFIYRNEQRDSMDLIFMYFGKNPDFEKENESFSLSKGLGLFGKPGTGKTTVLQTFEKLGKEYQKKFNNPFFMFNLYNCKEIAFNYQADEKERDLTSMYSKGVKCFDDLGTEDLSFGRFNCMEYILENRYNERFLRQNKSVVTHFTTNLSAHAENDQIKDFYGFRIRDRLKQMSNFILLDGESMRK